MRREQDEWPDVLHPCTHYMHVLTLSPLGILCCLCPFCHPTSRFQRVAWTSSWFHPAGKMRGYMRAEHSQLTARNCKCKWLIEFYGGSDFTRAENCDGGRHQPPGRLQQTPPMSPLHLCFYPFSERKEQNSREGSYVSSRSTWFSTNETQTWKKASTCCCGTSPVSAG